MTSRVSADGSCIVAWQVSSAAFSSVRNLYERHLHASRAAIALQVLNAGISAVIFNILYDVLLSQKLKWYAMLPVIDYWYTFPFFFLFPSCYAFFLCFDQERHE